MLDMLIPWWGQIKVALIAAAAAGLFFAGWEVNGWRYEASIAKMQADAANTLTAETERVRQIEHDAVTRVYDLEKANAKAQADIDTLHDRAVRAVSLDHGLFDARGRAGSRGTMSSAPGGPAVDLGPPAGCQLSEQASFDLLDLARDADRLLERARTAKAWAEGMK